nr:enoyl-CoA hydratase/isomerase family protein [Desulfobacterales bacterium]
MRTDFRTIRVEMRGRIALLTLDNPPVNQLSDHFVRELAQAIEEAFRDGSVSAVVLTGTGKNFIAGADITQIKDIRDREKILALLRENNRFLKGIET